MADEYGQASIAMRHPRALLSARQGVSEAELGAWRRAESPGSVRSPVYQHSIGRSRNWAVPVYGQAPTAVTERGCLAEEHPRSAGMAPRAPLRVCRETLAQFSLGPRPPSLPPHYFRSLP